VSGAIVWFTGLPSSGKTTLARAVAARLGELHVPCALLDGDEVRAALVPARGYGARDRDDFYATLGNLAGLLAGQGLVVLVPATAHLRRYREAVRTRARRVIEVHVTTTLDECARRDSKGLYRAIAEGTLSGVPGVDEPYEPPAHPEVNARGGEDPRAVDEVVTRIMT
jgi:adenylylsulfate kinase